MIRPNAKNERIKREYVRYLEEAWGRDAATVDRVLKSLSRFEESTRRKDFKVFHREQAVAFKRKLSGALNGRTGERLSKATMHSILQDLHAFFFWLAHLPGYKSHIRYADADYFNLSDKDVAIARARREKRVPTLAQVEQVLTSMPAETIVERRNRAVLAFAVATGARVSALASLRHGDVNVVDAYVDQDARHVRTKFRKTFRTFLMPVSELALSIATDWHAELSADPRRGPQDPLFPATRLALSEDKTFTVSGLAAHGWSSSGPIREIFRGGFTSAGLPYFNPHSIRDMLVRHIVSLNLPTETLKSWSQNLGHEGLLTTLTSYGAVPTHRQGELIREGLPKHDRSTTTPDPTLVAALVEALHQTEHRKC
jgi:site-specific recombinase XerD